MGKAQTSKKFRLFGPQYSLRHSLLALILLGTVAASAVFFTVRFIGNFAVGRYYVTEEKRDAREVHYMTDLQEYVRNNHLSADDLSQVSDWLSSRRFVYIVLFREDEVIFSGDEWHNIGIPGDTGFTVKYPSEEELLRFAQSGEPYPLVFSDQTVACSVAEFSEYMLYDTINIISLILAMLTLSVSMIVYFSKTVGRISQLADDVAVVTDGDMTHTIHADAEEDEISDLTRRVEAMRSSIVSTLENERRAVDANTELITAMSHDIRTPLTVLLGYIDLLKGQCTDTQSAAYLKATEATAMRLKDLSDDMFRYFTAFGNRPEVNIQHYDATTLLDQMLSEHLLLLEEQGYSIDAARRASLKKGTELVTDAPNMMRIIDNIFSNIYKYADPSAPICAAFIKENDVFYLQISNKVRQDTHIAESTGIGQKTCQRIADAIGSTFEAIREGDRYIVRISLPMCEGGTP